MARIRKKTNEMMTGLICDCGHDYACHAAWGFGCGECGCGKSRTDIVDDFVEQHPGEKVTLPGAIKHDQNKLPYDLLPPKALAEIVRVLRHGINKYGRRNWESGFAWHRPFAAAMRHLWSWWDGEDYDPETGISSLAHAACMVIFMLEFTLTGAGQDDRPYKKVQEEKHVNQE